MKRYAPFDSLPEQDVLDLAGSGRVKFHESEEYVYQQRQEAGRFLWVIQQGTIELINQHATGETLGDILAEGDVLGLDRFVGSGTYLQSARTASDVLLYALDASRFETLMLQFPAVKQYVAAHFSANQTGLLPRDSWLNIPLPPTSFLKARNQASASHIPSLPENGRAGDAVRAMLLADSVAVRMNGCVLSADDLALFCDRNPIRILREIQNAKSIEELAPLVRQADRMVRDGLTQPANVDDCLLLSDKLFAAAVESCIGLASGNQSRRGCWVAFGSLARGELLQDGAPRIAVISDGADAPCLEATSNIASFLAECGLHSEKSAWPAGSHPCMPLSDWKRFYTETIEDPVGTDLFARREFFDIRKLAGDDALFDQLNERIATKLHSNRALISLLANDTLSKLPPLTFFRGLVMGLDGREQEALQLTEVALNPISDAARVLMLHGGLTDTKATLDRLRKAGDSFPDDRQIFADATEAFRVALHYQVLFRGASIQPSRLGQYDRRLLKTTFAAILRLLELTASQLI